MANKKRDQSLVDQLRVKFLQLSDENKQKVQGLMIGLEHAQKVVPPLKGITTVKHEGYVP
ncbi:MAG: hypothetical protein LBK43_08175 [Treponema sp.]|nr:hypothetical protein [Treponema sp.]